ncbi:MAG TPA: hypothetical protein PKI55_03075, partial [Chitinophagaceae bacterium]|nr:hypothetical protein [Chitinophagaceae bacterium]
YSLNSYREKKNNYNFWPIEDSLLGKKVYYLDKYDLYLFNDSLKTGIGWIGYKYDSSFISFAKVKIDVSQKKVNIREGDEFTLDCSFAIPGYYSNFIRKSANLHDTIRIGVYQSGKWKKDIYTILSLKEMVERKKVAVIINPGLVKGNYFLRFAINSGYRNATHNSDKIKLIVN